MTNWTAMPQASKYEFRENPAAEAEVRSAIQLIKLMLQAETDILPKHRREVLNVALWKVTEAASDHKHRTRFCSAAVFSLPDCECRHDHVFQRGKMIEHLMQCGPDAVDKIVSKSVACTITKEEHVALNKYKHLDGWERYRRATITVVDATTGEIFDPK